ncbi:MAG: efflux RND transporter periplasmic adaptor subunit [Gemmatimonadales bacterium]|nr:efflux RND transporter periplasmic adaptor subunit [Gemmatimonadales bacterium]
MREQTWGRGALALAALGLVACGRGSGTATPAATPASAPGTAVAAVDTLVPALLDAAGQAAPLSQAVLATKLMGSVTEVLVREGDMVRAGQVLLRIDARDLDAQRAQVRATLAAAEAVAADARRQAERFRRLAADSAAPRVQLEAVETGLVRAESAVRAAEASARELEATGAYAALRAPFAGRITRRAVDPGAFAAPGTPLLTVQDARVLRVTAAVAPRSVRGLARGRVVEVLVEGVPARGEVDAVVPAPAGALQLVHVLVPNADLRLPAGAAATVRVPLGVRPARLVPAAALVREGDLVGVRLPGPGAGDLRWLAVGEAFGDRVEVLAGLRAGESVLVPPAAEAR